MLWTRLLWRETSGTHELIRASEINFFSKLLLNPRLDLFALPDDALLKVLLETSSKLLLLARGQDSGRALVLSPTIPQSSQTQVVIPPDDEMSGWDGIFRDLEDVAQRAALDQERKKLRSSSLYGTGRRTIERPEVLSLMLKLNRERFPGDASA